MVKVEMTQAAFAAKCAELKKKQGIELAGNAGTIAKDGITANYSYDGSNLTVTVTKKPVFIPQSSVESRLRMWLATA